ncbi:hypothetical protein CPB97_009915 [Podila verticillata]|nr:hypothetical protein CPB97_009915 [Podila verticillata]
MAFAVQDTNQMGTPFPTDWMLLTIIRSTIQRNTTSNINTGHITCRWNDHEIELIPDPNASPQAFTSERNLARLVVGSEIEARGLMTVRAVFSGSGKRCRPVLGMTLELTHVKLGDGSGSNRTLSPSGSDRGGPSGDGRRPPSTDQPPRGGSPISRGKRRKESPESQPEWREGSRPPSPKRLRPWSSGSDDGGARTTTSSRASTSCSGTIIRSVIPDAGRDRGTARPYSATFQHSEGQPGTNVPVSTSSAGPSPSAGTIPPPATPSAPAALPAPASPPAGAPPSPAPGEGGGAEALAAAILAATGPLAAPPFDPLVNFQTELHHFDDYGRPIYSDGQLMQQRYPTHTLFTFRQNRNDESHHWLHVLARNSVHESYTNITVWEEVMTPNTGDSIEGLWNHTFERIEVPGRMAGAELLEYEQMEVVLPHENWPLQPTQIIYLDEHGAIADAGYLRDESVPQGEQRYSFSMTFMNRMIRIIHVLLRPQEDDSLFRFELWEEMLQPPYTSATWRRMFGHGPALHRVRGRERRRRLLQSIGAATYAFDR